MNEDEDEKDEVNKVHEADRKNKDDTVNEDIKYEEHEIYD